jgi:hypothetical protein
VNGQVRVAATLANPDRKLQPGLHGEMVIVVEE